jgi:hypothetical protein
MRDVFAKTPISTRRKLLHWPLLVHEWRWNQSEDGTI